ncbi:Fe-S-cluster-containing hydrogenase component 2 [Sedimentibacter acidaminivorans]|uniref:Fe-S-cluster-containing hydrogenase component 2 n=1 Tax=Sedimentibacter acidaminivorans TaxID=913099 RepID=A0ABS4GER8_9FIRM|nr:4Fe-4S dicluster domain-containing protein [Sedimentibacter acidaminivorans]MBP1926179.1 Fe-S-cluster-containing hydrogenase component 2 [Sedimentibacter acidaminivorans]
MSKGIVISPEKCTGCRTCELVCSFYKIDEFNPKDAAISVLSYDEAGIQVPMTCLQCDEPHCMTVCTVNAITKDSKTGIVHVDGEKCIGCKMCVSACPFGNMTYSSRQKKVIKCDLCDGYPQCVRLCPSGALDYKELDSSLQKRKNIASQFVETLREGAK